MTTPSLATILFATLLISVLGLAGGIILLWREHAVKRLAPSLISFAAGSILGAALLELLPEALAAENLSVETTALLILLGIVVFFFLEKLLLIHHHSHENDADGETPEGRHLRTARPLVIFGDAVHNFLDGAIIAVAFLTDWKLGIVTGIAVVAHELPQEIGDFSILIHSGMDRGRVLFWNVLGALVGPLGALVGYGAFEEFERAEPIVIAFVVGNFIYLALADLVPTIKHESRRLQSVAQLVLLIIGIALVWWVGIVLPEPS